MYASATTGRIQSAAVRTLARANPSEQEGRIAAEGQPRDVMAALSFLARAS